MVVEVAGGGVDGRSCGRRSPSIQIGIERAHRRRATQIGPGAGLLRAGSWEGAGALGARPHGGRRLALAASGGGAPNG